jgi:hypothetical protein
MTVFTPIGIERRWYSARVSSWLSSQRIKDTVSYDRIIGCPHQEGLDYPLGRTCPQGPFCQA